MNEEKQYISIQRVLVTFDSGIFNSLITLNCGCCLVECHSIAASESQFPLIPTLVFQEWWHLVNHCENRILDYLWTLNLN